MEDMKQHDACCRVLISCAILDAYSVLSVAGKDGATEAIKKYSEALELSENLYYPTDGDLADRRKIYRGLGRATYLRWLDDSEYATLIAAYDYYRLGYPVTEDSSEYVVITYLFMMEELYKQSENQYGEEYCNALELIYRDYFRNFIDNDFQIMVCSQLIKQKCSGKYCERDLQGAERLNEHFLDFARKKESGELESDCSVEEFWGYYDGFGQLISNERMTSSSDKKSSESTFLKKVFPISYGAGTLGILLLKIAVYWLIELVGGIIGGIVPYLGMILSVSFSIYCWVGIILSIVQYVKNR